MTYDYECKDCGKKFEVVKKMTEDLNNIICPYCESRNVRKIFYSIPVHFKAGKAIND